MQFLTERNFSGSKEEERIMQEEKGGEGKKVFTCEEVDGEEEDEEDGDREEECPPAEPDMYPSEVVPPAPDPDVPLLTSLSSLSGVASCNTTPGIVLFSRSS